MKYNEFIIGASNLSEDDIFRIKQAIENLIENDIVGFEPLADGEVVLVNEFEI